MHSSSITPAAGPSIAIIGAGPAGLTLARLLHISKVDINVTIYELDTSSTSRPGQGGTLDLHSGSGLLAMERCNIGESFNKYARYDASRMVIADKNGTEVINLEDSSNSNPEFQRPEIDRVKLREILLESIPPKCIKWEHHLKEVTQDGKLFLESGAIDGPFDLIVGADGAWSKVRKILHADKPVYSGVSGFEMKIRNSTTKCPQIDEMVGKGSYIAMSDGQWLGAQRLGDDSIEVRNFYSCPEGEAKMTLDKLGKEGTRDEIVETCHDWAPEILEIVRQADVDTMKAWTLYELPVGTKWTHKEGFTLLGDAASLATPFAGQGVNKAMEDALKLSQQIEKAFKPGESGSGTTLDEAVASYEEEMFIRAERVQRWTMINKINALGPKGGPVIYFVGFVREMLGDSETWWVRWLASAPIMAMLSTYFHARVQLGWAVRKFWTRK